MIDTAIGPLKTELKQLNDRIQALESQGTSPGPKSGFDPTDPAFKRIEFVGFAESVPHANRIKEIEKFMSKSPGARYTDIGSSYKGPYNNRSLTKKCYIEFGNSDAMRAAFDLIKDSEFKFQGIKINIRKGITKFNGQRNWAIFKAK